MKQDYRETRWYLAAQILGAGCVMLLTWAALYRPEILEGWDRPLILVTVGVWVGEALTWHIRTWKMRREVSAFMRTHKWPRSWEDES